MFANVDNGYGVFANFFLDILRLSYFIIWLFNKKNHTAAAAMLTSHFINCAHEK